MAHIATKQLAQLCHRVGTSLDAGIDARRVWQLESERGPQAHRLRMERVRQRIAAGDSTADALAAADDYFPMLAREMVDVGEKTGKLDQVFLSLGEHYDHLLRLRRTFIAGVTWPGIQLAVAIVVIGLFIWAMGEFVPRTSDGEPQIDLLGLGAGNEGLFNYVMVVLLIGVGLFLAVKGLFAGWFGPAPFELITRTPVIGSAFQTMALSRLAWSLGMANDAGMDARRSVGLALRSTQTVYYTSHAEQIDLRIRDGGEIHEALRETGVFPDEFVDAVQTGEHAGQLPESMLRLSNNYRQRAESSAGVLTVIASFAVWAVVAAIIIIFIFKLFMFYLGGINSALDGL